MIIQEEEKNGSNIKKGMVARFFCVKAELG